MKDSKFKIILWISLLFNLTILCTVIYFYISFKMNLGTPDFVLNKREDFLFEKLSLNPDQQKVMKQRIHKLKSDIKTDRGQIKQKMKIILNELRSENPDMNKIDKILAEINSIHGDIHHRVTKKLLEDRNILNREQYLNLLNLFEQTMDKRKHDRLW